jgi:hypothetical protein
MIIADLPSLELRKYLYKPGIFYRIGPFTIHLQSDLPGLAELIQRLYADYSLAEDTTFADFHIALYRPSGLRRWWRPQVQFRTDVKVPFQPFPQDTALPFLEWGLNWCVAMHAHHYLMLHAAVLEKQGSAVLLPAWPGSGKSTLCAALSLRGWRLLSDEFALVRPADLAIVPFPRLIPLKNESIPVIRAFAPDAVMGPEFPKTRKGTVAHLRPPRDSITRAQETAQARWIVFPHFEANADLRLKTLSKERAFLKLAGNSFNYELIGLRGFETVSGLIGNCACYLLQYSDLEQAVTQLDALVTGQI